MTDYNKQNPNQQSKAENLLSAFNAKFEWIEKIPTTQLPAKYFAILVGLILVVIAWKFIAVGKVESDMAKKLENERALITQQAREYADQQYVKEEERFGQVLSWAVRGELIRNNIDQIDQYLSEIVRMKDTRKFCVLGELAQMVGWTKKDTVERLEQRRKEKAEKFHQLKQKKAEARAKAADHKDLAKVKEELAKYGF